MSLITTSHGRSRPWRRLFRQSFYSAFAIAAFLIVASYLQNLVSDDPSRSPQLGPRYAEPVQCRDVHRTPDVCSFVKTNCDDEQPGLVPYLTVYHCAFGYARVVGFPLLVIWLGLLFSTIGIAASDFFTPNLQTIASVLNMPENLAGVTFLAVGNGSPDLFSTVMSMRSNNAALAVGELIGAACFITAIVAGSIAMIREFKVDKRSFVRDLLFFIVAVCLTLVFLLDGYLHLFECIIMIAYYAFYVIFVGASHWYTMRRSRRAALAESRAHAIEEALQASGQERYEDQPGAAAQVAHVQALARPSRPESTISMPRIEIEGDQLNEVEEEDDGRMRREQMAVEIANNMRVRQPTASRRPTAAFIRPSLVGALEFNSALEHFKKEGLSPPGRIGHFRRHSVQNIPRAARFRSEAPPEPTISFDTTSPPLRERAHSHTGNVRDVTDNAPYSGGPALPPHVREARQEQLSGSPSPSLSPSRAASSTRSFQLDGNLAVPPIHPFGPRQPYLDTQTEGSARQSLAPEPLHLHIPSRRSTTSEPSDTLSPFPGYVESPMPMSPTSEAAPPSLFEPPLPIIPTDDGVLVEVGGGVGLLQPYRWWPYSILPPPESMMATLFPTLQNWREKTFADAFVSTLAVPSVFFLSITLPVVDARDPEIDETSQCSECEEENEPSRQSANDQWEMFRRYRRNTVTSNRTLNYDSATPSSPLIVDEGVALDMDRPTVPKPVETPSLPLDESGQVDAEDAGWNKWLVMIQTLAGPPFSVFIISSVLMEQPAEEVVSDVKWSLVASGALILIVWLTTRSDRRPKYYTLLCFPGFLVSVSWIAVIAGEVVGVLKAIGVILGISDAILGLTVFAAGNSVGDWVSDYTIARLGSPVMAL